MRVHLVWTLGSSLLLSAAVSFAQTSPVKADSEPLLSTGVTGSIGASGLDDPQYVLSFIPVQRLMLEATRHPLMKEDIDKAVVDTPVTLNILLRLELLRREENKYRLNYLLLTVADEQAVYRVSAHYGESLADAFRRHKSEFEAILRHQQDATMRAELMFDLIAGAALNWNGLSLATELGYRVQPPRHANGDIYLIHSKERGTDLDFTGLYLDSQTAPGSKMNFSTFGDGDSLPRLQGVPDVFDGMENAVENWKNLPDVYGALRSEYIALLLTAIDDAGQIMSAVEAGKNTDEGLRKSISLPTTRRDAMLSLLKATGYLSESDHRYFVGVPVLTAADKPMVEAALQLGRKIMEQWLRDNYPAMEKELGGLSPMRNGLPFALAFNEVWHYTFGFATKSLAESGFYVNPRALGYRYQGYVPLVWASSLPLKPGS